MVVFDKELGSSLIFSKSEYESRNLESSYHDLLKIFSLIKGVVKRLIFRKSIFKKCSRN